jgi:hypothetical protein
LSLDLVLSWADEHRRRTGRWPTAFSGGVLSAPGENWRKLDNALRYGLRGLPKGSSLARLLAQRRGVRNLADLPPLVPAVILAWADAHRARTGRWPTEDSGPVEGGSSETWRKVDAALREGLRGLPGGSSLAGLIARERGVRNRAAVGRLTVRQILAWADAHHERTGQWPTAASGPIPEAPGETWRGVNLALGRGGRGLRGGSSLYRLLKRNRRIAGRRSPLTHDLQSTPGHQARPRGRRPDAAKQARAVALRADGLSFVEIARRLGCSKQYAHWLIRTSEERAEPGRGRVNSAPAAAGHGPG